MTWEVVKLADGRYAYAPSEIGEFPVSNTLGRRGPDLLEAAEEKLRDALKQKNGADDPPVAGPTPATSEDDRRG